MFACEKSTCICSLGGGTAIVISDSRTEVVVDYCLSSSTTIKRLFCSDFI